MSETNMPVWDHCHKHNIFRGFVCSSCNTIMALIDRRITPKLAGPATLTALLEHVRRCGSCQPLTAADLGPTTSLRLAKSLSVDFSTTTSPILDAIRDAAHLVSEWELKVEAERAARDEVIRRVRRTTTYTVREIAEAVQLSEQAVKGIVAGIKKGR